MNQLEREWGPTSNLKTASGYHIQITDLSENTVIVQFRVVAQDTRLSDRELHQIYEGPLMKGMKQFLVQLRKLQQNNVDFDFPEQFSVSVGASRNLFVYTSVVIKVKSTMNLKDYGDLSAYLQALAQGIGVKVSFD